MENVKIYDGVVGNTTAGINTTTNAVIDTITVGASDPQLSLSPQQFLSSQLPPPNWQPPSSTSLTPLGSSSRSLA